MMAENSKIEWTGHTFNPWIGCTKVSDGCKHCYAETLMDKRYGKVKWGPQGQRVRTSAANWRKPLAWNRKAKAEGKRARVFCASLADVFEIREGHEQCDELQIWRHDLFDLIGETPHLDWLLLTKRPQNVMDCLNWYTGTQLDGMTAEYWLESHPNVWIGTSVENQEQADKRIPELLKIPAAVRFLSMEPLLGPVDISRYLEHNPEICGCESDWPYCPFKDWKIHWVIVGGESGPNARPVHPDWARSIRDQCVDAGVPFFFKQWGEWAHLSQHSLPQNLPYRAREWSGNPKDLSAMVGKKAAGRMLDGREWSEFPRLAEEAPM